MKIDDRVLSDPLCPLLRPVKEYFPSDGVAEWFHWPEATQNSWARNSLGGACPIFGFPGFGERLEAHHILPKGMGSKDHVKVPWLLIPALVSPSKERNAHELYHHQDLTSSGFRILKWDILDEKDGFHVADEMGEEIPKENLYFYNRPHDDQIKAAVEWQAEIKAQVTQRTKAIYRLVEYSLWAKEEKIVEKIGYESVDDWMGQHAVMYGLLKKGQKCLVFLGERWSECEKKLVPIEMLDLVRRKTKREDRDVIEEWVTQMIAMCSPLSPHPSISSFITNINLAFPANKTRRATVVRGECQIETVEVEDYGELFGEGIVIRGWPVSET